METVTLEEVSNFLDVDKKYLKFCLVYFAPELMKPFEDLDLNDENNDELIKFPDTKDTWKLISFSLCNMFIEDIAKCSGKLLDAIDVLCIHINKR